jgi:NADH pyrophosphatase NudC (nudix superfamily)
MTEQTNVQISAERRIGQGKQPDSASPREEMQPCPRCGHPMPALKGGSTSICANCGYKDSCCY